MDFEEKIDAMRTTLELAVHDIEANRVATAELRSAIRDLHGVVQEQQQSIREQQQSFREQRFLAEADRENISQLRVIAAQLVVVAQAHDARLNSIEKRI